VTAGTPSFDSDDAYAVLAAIHERRRRLGWQPVGRKIGFTNFTIWERYGVDRPMWATVWDRSVIEAVDNRTTFALGGTVQPRIEPEVVFRLAGPLPITDDPVAILEAVEWMAPGFEIVQCHYLDWRFTVADCTASFGLHRGLVVGTPIAITDANRATIAATLPTFEVTLSRAGQVVDRGVGANVLDSPALALAHLARVVAGQRDAPPLAAGEIITTGTVTDAWPVAPGERWTSDYGTLPVGGLEIAFT
jgi:2-oxo-3-hexenedioate decarboxylase